MDERATGRRGRDIGPDPRLNGTGVALTGRQRLVLAGLAVVIGAGVVLVLLGIPWAPPGAPAGRGARIELTGSGRAAVDVVLDGRPAPRRTLPLPATIPVDRDVNAVAVAAQLLGRDGGTGLACALVDAAGRVLQDDRASGDRAAVRCQAVLP